MLSPDLANRLEQATATAIEFWFHEPANRDRWFASTPEFDAAIGDRFGSLLSELLALPDHGDIVAWPCNGQQRLGLILLCDQFPRNLYRGRAEAFALDSVSQRVAYQGVEAGQDRMLGIPERVFFYLPFEHAESRAAQHLCVGLLTELRDTANPDDQTQVAAYLSFAEHHREIVLRFGRFPHRNRALGRASSAEEAEFAKGGSFGQ